MAVVMLANNALSGTIPAAWEHNSKLAELQLSNNQLTGSIPESLCEIGPIAPDFCYNGTKNCQLFLLQENRLTGTLPACLANLTSMASFNAGGRR